MSDSPYRYSGPSQEYSPGDIDPVSNHVVLDVSYSGEIISRQPGSNDELTQSAINQFGNYAISGDLHGYYSYLESYGSDYGSVVKVIMTENSIH